MATFCVVGTVHKLPYLFMLYCKFLSLIVKVLTVAWCFLHGIYQLGTGDVTEVNIIAFRRFSQMDISGNVVVNSSTDHINTLKVCAGHLCHVITEIVCHFLVR